MAITPEDLKTLGDFIEGKVEAAIADVRKDVAAVKSDATAAEATPVVQEAVKAIEYYVHLADGTVQTMTAADADTSHVNGVAVIGKYQVGA
jgi:hypothetical protein